jgi:hypothetical protein
MYPFVLFRKAIKIIINIQFCSWFWRFATIYRWNFWGLGTSSGLIGKCPTFLAMMNIVHIAFLSVMRRFLASNSLVILSLISIAIKNSQRESREGQGARVHQSSFCPGARVLGSRRPIAWIWLFNRLKSDQNLSSALDKHRRYSRE